MCLNTTKESFEKASKIRKTDQYFIGYKIVGPDGSGIYYSKFKWPNKGKVVSNRRGTRRTSYEKDSNVIEKGLHLAINKPEKCPSPCLYLCRYLWKYQCTKNNLVNKVLKVKYYSKDIVSYGTWKNIKSVVVTKCEVLGEVKMRSKANILIKLRPKLIIKNNTNLYWTGNGWSNACKAAAKRYASPNELPGYIEASDGIELELILKRITPVLAAYYRDGANLPEAEVIEVEV